jgi:hypothetical protein
MNTLSGFAFDTEKKTYKTFKIEKSLWLNMKPCSNLFAAKKNFKMPGALNYELKDIKECNSYMDELEKSGFVTDSRMALDFGTMIL